MYRLLAPGTSPRSFPSFPAWRGGGTPPRSLEEAHQLLEGMHVLSEDQPGGAPPPHRRDVLRPVIDEQDFFGLDGDLVALLDFLDDLLDRFFLRLPAELRELEVLAHRE